MVIEVNINFEKKNPIAVLQILYANVLQKNETGEIKYDEVQNTSTDSGFPKPPVS